MAQLIDNQSESHLREFSKKHAQMVYDFTFYMLPAGSELEETLLSTFRTFGDFFRKHHQKANRQWEEMEMRVQLLRMAWESIRRTMSSYQFVWTPGRDTRSFEHLEKDLIEIWSGDRKLKPEAKKGLIERFRHLDPELRAPIVLKDLLHLEDEEVLRVLQIRWGVYRHRLHRGRVEFKDGLRGMARGATL